MPKLEEELKDRLHTKRLDKLTASFAGACINRGHGFTIDDGSNIFVKTNGSQHARVMFDGELESLQQIRATKTIRVPNPITVVHNYDGKDNSALAMEFLELNPLEGKSARLLGKKLHDLHSYNSKILRFNERASRWVGKRIPSAKQASNDKLQNDQSDNSAGEDEENPENQFTKHSYRQQQGPGREPEQAESSESQYAERFVPEPDTEEVKQFGFKLPTSCGAVPQVNEWTRDWVSFYARHRLDYTIRMILSDHSDRELNEQWSHLQNKIDKFFSDFDYKGSREGDITPALLHGDLWSGNAAQIVGSDSSVHGVVYDPASFYGHSEYEFGIVRMFGGFPEDFEQAYFEETPKKKLFEKRNKLYQLFHHLNHWNHFGSGYRSSSLRIMKDLNSEKL